MERAKELLKGSGTPAAEREHLGARLHGDVRADSRRGAGGERRRPAAARQSGSHARASKSLARTLGGDRLDRMFTAVAEAEDALDRNVSPKVVADWLAINVH